MFYDDFVSNYDGNEERFCRAIFVSRALLLPQSRDCGKSKVFDARIVLEPNGILVPRGVWSFFTFRGLSNPLPTDYKRPRTISNIQLFFRLRLPLARPFNGSYACGLCRPSPVWMYDCRVLIWLAGDGGSIYVDDASMLYSIKVMVTSRALGDDVTLLT